MDFLIATAVLGNIAAVYALYVSFKKSYEVDGPVIEVHGS